VNFANVLVAVKKDQTAKVSSLTRFTVPLLLARHIHLTSTSNQLTLNIGQQAQAKRSGGRSGGGSFRSSPSRSSSSRRSSRSSDSDYSGGSYSPRSNVYVVSGGNPVYYDSPMPVIVLLIILGIIAFALVSAIRSSINSSQSANHAIGSGNDVIGNSEIDNNIVTISKIQVGLLATARAIQTQLSESSLNTDTETPEGLVQLLQEAALALLRTQENWTHVSASSKTVRSREEAQAIFTQLSIEERSKFSAETLMNVNGKVRRSQDNSKQDNEPGSYIVVTLLIGTENDRPLFGDVYSAEALKQALERIAATPPEYLTVFELLWTPQSETESLTEDELLTEYTKLMQII
jgi:uncharacterized membrane protein